MQNLLSETAVNLPGPATLGGTEDGSWCNTEDFNVGKIFPVGNNRRSLLNFKSNRTEHDYGKKRELRKSNWTGKSLSVEVNGEGKRSVAWKKGCLKGSIWVSRGQRDHVVGFSSVSRVHRPVVGLDQVGTQVGLPLPELTSPSRMEECVSPSVGDLRLLNEEAHAPMMLKEPHTASNAQDVTDADGFLVKESPAPPMMAGTTRQHVSKSATNSVGQSVVNIRPAKGAVVNRGPFSDGLHAGDSPTTLDRANLALLHTTGTDTLSAPPTKLMGSLTKTPVEAECLFSVGFSTKEPQITLGKAKTEVDRALKGLVLSNLVMSPLRVGIEELVAPGSVEIGFQIKAILNEVPYGIPKYFICKLPTLQ